MNQLHDGGWTHVYMTDKVFDPNSDDTALHNPWDAVPTYWDNLVKAVRFWILDGNGIIFFSRPLLF